jgi:hypothetical protein
MNNVVWLSIAASPVKTPGGRSRELQRESAALFVRRSRYPVTFGSSQHVRRYSTCRGMGRYPMRTVLVQAMLYYVPIHDESRILARRSIIQSQMRFTPRLHSFYLQPVRNHCLPSPTPSMPQPPWSDSLVPCKLAS